MIDFAYTGVQRHSDRHQIEFFTTVGIRLCQQLTGRHLRPERVTFKHLRTDIPDEIKKCFGSGIVFGGMVDRVTFSKVIRRMPVRSADPYLNALFRRYGDECRSARAGRLMVLPHPQGRHSLRHECLEELRGEGIAGYSDGA